MKKIIIKTILITLGVTLIFAISAFGIVSFCAPSAMMSLTASLGLDSISGDYAYQEYQRSDDIDCLARSFEVAAMSQRDEIANERFEELYAHEAFSSYCEAQDGAAMDLVSDVSYRDYVCGLAAQVKYRLARLAEIKLEVYEFALAETDSSFAPGNPVLQLAVQAVEAGDTEFCAALLERIPEAGFEENQTYSDIIQILEEVVGE